jgi:TRAP-type C4-dicarboxylate transport system permease large subunit
MTGGGHGRAVVRFVQQAVVSLRGGYFCMKCLASLAMENFSSSAADLACRTFKLFAIVPNALDQVANLLLR